MKPKKGKEYLCIKTVVMNGDENDISYIKGKVYKSEEIGYITNEKGNRHHMWTKKGMPEHFKVVEETKEESFVITKEQILELHKFSGIEAITTSLLKTHFPSVFVEEKKELPNDFTGWCKVSGYGNEKWIGKFENGFFKYGVNSHEKWFESDGRKHNFKITEPYYEATPQQVQSALKKEAVKRYKNQYLEPLNRHLFDRDDEKTDCIHLFDSNSLSIYENEIWVNYGKYCAVIFKDGIWATVIPIKQMTQCDIEKELGYKIEIVK